MADPPAGRPGELQAALPREHYLPGPAWAAGGGRGSGGAAGSASDGAPSWGWVRPERLAVVEVAGGVAAADVGRRGPAGTRTPTSAATAAPSCARTCRASPLRAARPRCCAAAYHSWTYGLDGALLRAPHTEATSTISTRPRSRCTRWRSTLGRVRLRPARRPAGEPASPATLGDVPARTRRYPLDALVSARRIVYEVAANWKVIAENYNECYHCGPVHPELTRLVPAFGDGGAGADGTGLDWDGRRPAPGRRLDVLVPAAPRRARRSPTWTTRSGCGTRASWSTRTCCCRCPPSTRRPSC